MKKKFLIIIFIICLGIGFTIGYLSIDKEKYSIDEEVTIEDATKIIEDFTIGFGCNNIEEYVKKDFVSNKDISNDRAFQVVQYLEFDTDINAITLEEVKRKVALYFGEDYAFSPSNLSNTCNLYGYNEEDNIFYKVKDLCVVNCGNTGTLYKVKDINKDNGFIDINVNILFNSESESINYYKDYSRKEIIDNTDDINLYIEQGDLYQFRFKKKGNNYQFISCKKS